jgi:hypothetical protein
MGVNRVSGKVPPLLFFLGRTQQHAAGFFIDVRTFPGLVEQGASLLHTAFRRLYVETESILGFPQPITMIYRILILSIVIITIDNMQIV